MYQYLSGRLVEKNPAFMVLDVSGIGYQIQIPVSTFSSLPEPGQPVKILTHFVVREDAQILYGFGTEDERRLFRLLISVSGIGPKIGITVLSGIPAHELKKAIIDGNLAVLTGIAGIGRKTAERMVIELREKVLLEDRKGSASAMGKMISQDARVEDSLCALVELGYKKQNAQDAIQRALKHLEPEYSVTDLIRVSLKYV